MRRDFQSGLKDRVMSGSATNRQRRLRPSKEIRRAESVKRIIGLFLPCIMLTQIAAGGSANHDPRSVLLRVSDMQTYLKPTARPNNVNNCLIVYTDGRLHLELRRQEFFFGNASYVSYEGKLTDGDLTFLRSILDSTDVKNLPTPPSPKLPLASDHFGWFTAEISRGSGVQEVGYWAWDGEPKPSENDEMVWEKERHSLESLAQWVRSTKGFNHAGWGKVRNAHSVCDR
jgi:hypothetical protein